MLIERPRGEDNEQYLLSKAVVWVGYLIKASLHFHPRMRRTGKDVSSDGETHWKFRLGGEGLQLVRVCIEKLVPCI